MNGWLLFALSYRDPADRSVQRAGELEYRHIPLAGPLFQQVRQHPKVNRVLSFLVPSN